MEAIVSGMLRNDWFIQYGNFLFKRRNAVFPLFLVPLFLMFTPNYNSALLLECGVISAVAGQLLRMSVIGFAYIKRGGLNKRVYADTLVTSGFFSLCRNPLYVGNFLILYGLLMMHGNPLVLLIGGLFFLIAYHAIVATEEQYLHTKFGKQYEIYCSEVPRWGFRMDRIKLLQFRSFNWKKVIYKDYSTFGSWGSQALVLMAYRDYVISGNITRTWPTLLVALIVLTLGIRVVKKKFPL